MPQPTTTGGALMSYPTTVDTGLVQPLALYDGELTGGSSVAGAANTAYFVGVTLYASAVLTGVRVHFGTGGAGHYDVGIYSDSNGSPSTLLANAAATATSLVTSTATLNPALIGGNLSLSPGKYWLALWIDNATDTINRALVTNTSMGILKSQSSTGPLPASASGTANTTLKPFLIGLLSGGWS